MGDVLHRKKGDFEFASTDVGPRYHIAAVVDSLLCGLVGKIVARMEENSNRLLDGEFDRAGAGCGLCDIM